MDTMGECVHACSIFLTDKDAHLIAHCNATQPQHTMGSVSVHLDSATA
jgi:hypothetical protein